MCIYIYEYVVVRKHDGYIFMNILLWESMMNICIYIVERPLNGWLSICCDELWLMAHKNVSLWGGMVIQVLLREWWIHMHINWCEDMCDSRTEPRG